MGWDGDRRGWDMYIGYELLRAEQRHHVSHRLMGSRNQDHVLRFCMFDFCLFLAQCWPLDIREVMSSDRVGVARGCSLLRVFQSLVKEANP